MKKLKFQASTKFSLSADESLYRSHIKTHIKHIVKTDELTNALLPLNKGKYSLPEKPYCFFKYY